MLKIIVNSEYPNESQNSSEHLKFITEFKAVLRETLSEYKGELEFDYISNFKQFNLKSNLTNIDPIKKEDIQKIQNQIPNCWI